MKAVDIALLLIGFVAILLTPISIVSAVENESYLFVVLTFILLFYSGFTCFEVIRDYLKE